MGVELVRNCYRSASRHPLLLFMICVLICIYRSFPVLFSILVHASPVIASTLLLLGTLLFYGHANAPEIQKGTKSHHHDFNLVFGGMGNGEIDEETYLFQNLNANDDHKFNQEVKSELGNRKLVLVNRFGQFQQFQTGNTKLKSRDGSRRNSIDPLQSVLDHIDDDDVDKGWDTGSDAVGSSSPSTSVADIFQMINDHNPMDSDVPNESGEMVNETDDDDEDDDHEDMLVKDFDEDETFIKWTENDQRNLMNLGTLELERNQRLDSLIARQKAIKNMRMMAEKNMANISNDIHSIESRVSTGPNTPFDLPNYPHENIIGSDLSNIMPRRYSFDLPYDPRVPERIVSDTESVGSTHTYNINENIIPRNQFSEDDDTVKLHQVVGDDRSNEVKTSGENIGYEDKTSRKSSSSSTNDVTDDINDGDGDDDKDNVEEENNSTADSSSATSDSEEEDSEESDTEEVGMVQRLKTWFTSW